MTADMTDPRNAQRGRRDDTRPVVVNVHNHNGPERRPVPPPHTPGVGEIPEPGTQAYFDAMSLDDIRYYRGYQEYLWQSGIRTMRRLRRPARWIGRIFLLLILIQLVWFTAVFAIQNRMVDRTPLAESILRIAELAHPQVEEANRSALLTEVEGFLLRAERLNNTGMVNLNSFYANQDLLRIANDLVDEARNPNTSAQLAREDLLTARRLAWRVLGR